MNPESAKAFWIYGSRLANYEFSCRNPLFWVLLAVIFFVLNRLWNFKRAFSFCLFLGVVLLATTRFEIYAAKAFASPGEPFDAGIIKLVSITLNALVFMLYAFMPR